MLLFNPMNEENSVGQFESSDNFIDSRGTSNVGFHSKIVLSVFAPFFHFSIQTQINAKV